MCSSVSCMLGFSLHAGFGLTIETLEGAVWLFVHPYFYHIMRCYMRRCSFSVWAEFKKISFLFFSYILRSIRMIMDTLGWNILGQELGSWICNYWIGRIADPRDAETGRHGVCDREGLPTCLALATPWCLGNCFLFFSLLLLILSVCVSVLSTARVTDYLSHRVLYEHRLYLRIPSQAHVM